MGDALGTLVPLPALAAGATHTLRLMVAGDTVLTMNELPPPGSARMALTKEPALGTGLSFSTETLWGEDLFMRQIYLCTVHVSSSVMSAGPSLDDGRGALPLNSVVLSMGSNATDYLVSNNTSTYPEGYPIELFDAFGAADSVVIASASGQSFSIGLSSSREQEGGLQVQRYTKYFLRTLKIAIPMVLALTGPEVLYRLKLDPMIMLT